jgi:hypothetical protein
LSSYPQEKYTWEEGVVEAGCLTGTAAVKPETSARRIQKLVGMLERNEKLDP